MISPNQTHARITPQRVRRLTADDLGVTPPEAEATHILPEFGHIEPLANDDPILEMVRDLAGDYGGIIFQGPPGTSKSWYAVRAAATLAAGEPDNWRPVQFHPSYQYEDFIEGFVPTTSGGYELVPKHFLELCQRARCEPGATVVLVIDELSRGDPGRVFGEALTYIERSKRGIPFRLASGTECVVPDNLLILATMNPLDRGVDEVDAALERRFAKRRFDPEESLLQRFLEDAGMELSLQQRVITFFKAINGRARTNPYASLGHTYFIGCADEADLRRLWEHQLTFHFEKAFRLSPDELESVFREWNRVLDVEGSEEGTAESGEAGAP